MNNILPKPLITSYDSLKTELAILADDEYRTFVMKICPSKRPFLGVRVPEIREIASRVPLASIGTFLKVTPIGYEEVLARGFLIARLPYTDLLKWFDSQIDYFDDWSACDTFCSAIGKLIRKHKSDFFDHKLDNLLNQKSEFAVRTGLVLLKCCYVEPDYLQVIFDCISKLKTRQEYYIKMAIAWLLTECFIKYPDETLTYLNTSSLPIWTLNKTISKICDSYRVDSETKEYLRSLRVISPKQLK